MKPPSGGPTIGPISAGIVSQAMASTSSRLSMRAHQHQPRHRRHHRAAHALQEAREHELASANRDSAQPIEPSMNTAIASRNTVRAPKRSAIQPLIGMKIASDEQVGGERELERQRVGADVGGDRRQRGRDDGRSPCSP